MEKRGNAGGKEESLEKGLRDCFVASLLAMTPRFIMCAAIPKRSKLTYRVIARTA